MSTDEFGLDVEEEAAPLTTAVEVRAHVISKARDIIDTAALMSTGRLSTRRLGRVDPDVLKQMLTLVSKLKTSEDPIEIPSALLEKLKEAPGVCQDRLQEIFMSFLEGNIKPPALTKILSGYSYIYTMAEVKDIADLLREQKAKYGRR